MVEPKVTRSPCVGGSITSALPTLASSSLMRPSMNPCLSRAAWYSAFSLRSPWARASAMALMMAGRSIDLRRSSSSLSFSKPGRVMGVRWMAMSASASRGRQRLALKLDLGLGARALQPGRPCQPLLLGQHFARELVALPAQSAEIGGDPLENAKEVHALRRLHRLGDAAAWRLQRGQHHVTRE